MIKDTGAREEFGSGAVRDMKEGKGRCDLLPLEIIDSWLDWEVGSNNILLDLEKFQKTLNVDYIYSILNTFVCTYYNGAKIDAILDLSIHFEEGASKYEEWNWAKGIDLWSFIDSGVRHYLKVLAEMKDESHERAFMWNLVCAAWTVENRPDLCKYLDYDQGYLPLNED